MNETYSKEAVGLNKPIHNPIGHFVMKVVFTFIGLVFGAVFLFQTLNGLYAYTWPTTTATVLSAKVVGFAEDISKPEIIYNYEIDNKTYTSYRIRFGMLALFPELLKPFKFLEPYATGSEILVYYNPNRPEQAVIRKGVTLQHMVLWLTIFSLTYLMGVVMISGKPIEIDVTVPDSKIPDSKKEDCTICGGVGHYWLSYEGEDADGSLNLALVPTEKVNPSDPLQLFTKCDACR